LHSVSSPYTSKIPEEIKSERLQKVQRLATQHALERSERYVDTIVEVLVEERNAKDTTQVMGRNRQNRPVFFEGDIAVLRGKLVPVKITEARPWSLTGVQAGDYR
jgi:tRNA-2-methylthio-N6-dimethylallyladenosine synthase